MHSRKKLLIATAIIEVGAGLSLASVPGLVMGLLLGVQEASLEALVVGRVASAGLLAIGSACWLSRDDRGSSSQDGLLWGLLIYNIGACAVLGWAGSTASIAGIALWPAVALHAFMTIWCAAVLRTIL